MSYVDVLDDVELLIECEVRGMRDKAGVTATLKEALKRKLEEEKENTFLIPSRPHEAARKQPQREIEACTKKLSQLHQLLVQKLETQVPIGEWWAETVAKLGHVKGRANRVSQSDKFFQMSSNLRQAVEECGQIASQVKNGELTSEEALAQLKEVVLEIPDKVPPTKPESPTKEVDIAGTSKQVQAGKLGETVPGQGLRVDPDPEFGNLLEGLRLEPNSQEELSRSEANNPFYQMLHSSTKLPGSRMWSDAKLRQEVKTWKIRFQGVRSELTVQRFLSRVEWHAIRAQIPCDYIIGALDLCLEDEALEWFWSSVDRNPEIMWNELKQGLVLRFASSITDDDVRRMLNNRKQRYPRESVLEFYQAIQKLALQSDKPVSDNALYTIMRRNIRPGLQMALHDEVNFASLATFIRRCSSLEDMWRSFGHNPEATLANPSRSIPYPDQHRIPLRRQVAFDPRTPKVQELAYPDAQEEVEDESFSLSNSYEDEACQEPQVSALYTRKEGVLAGNSRHFGMRTNASGTSALRTNRLRCWNCTENTHTFMDCRKPITSVFCFGCGARDTFKADCVKCNPPENWRAEMRRPREPHLPSPPTTRTTEEAACNTDPELARMNRR